MVLPISPSTCQTCIDHGDAAAITFGLKWMYLLGLCQYFICVWSISYSRAILCFSEINNKKVQEGNSEIIAFFVELSLISDQNSKSQKTAYWHNTAISILNYHSLPSKINQIYFQD